MLKVLFTVWAVAVVYSAQEQMTTSKKMISISSVRSGLRVTQSGEQTTSSNGENILYCTVHITVGLFFNDWSYFWLPS